MFWFFGREACGILAPRPGIEPAPPALEGEVSTTGPPGKSLDVNTLDVPSLAARGDYFYLQPILVPQWQVVLKARFSLIFPRDTEIRLRPSSRPASWVASVYLDEFPKQERITCAECPSSISLTPVGYRRLGTKPHKGISG